MPKAPPINWAKRNPNQSLPGLPLAMCHIPCDLGSRYWKLWKKKVYAIYPIEYHSINDNKLTASYYPQTLTEKINKGHALTRRKIKQKGKMRSNQEQ